LALEENVSKNEGFPRYKRGSDEGRGDVALGCGVRLAVGVHKAVVVAVTVATEAVGVIITGV
jgi:hypothetical protein